MSLDIASVGFEVGHDDVTDVEFYGGETLSSFDVVLLDPRIISEFWRSFAGQKNDLLYKLSLRSSIEENKNTYLVKKEINRRKDEIKELLFQCGGQVVTRLVPQAKLQIRVTKKKTSIPNTESFHSYDWLPRWKYKVGEKDIGGALLTPSPSRQPSNPEDTVIDETVSFPRALLKGLERRQGRPDEEIELNPEHPFKKYHEFLNNSEQADLAYEAALIYEEEKEWIDHVSVISQQRAGNILSVELPLGDTGGSILFLPVVDVKDTEAESGQLISSIIENWETPTTVTSPGWVNQYSVPGVDTYEEEIADLDREISKIEQEKESLVEEKNELEQYKLLLHSKGEHLLEPTAREALRLIGFEVEEEVDFDEEIDGLISHSDIENKALIEVEGKDNDAVNIDKFRQLLQKVVSLRSNFEDDVTGVLIGNGYRYLEPAERESQFTENVLKQSVDQDFSVIETADLFSAVRKILRESDNENSKENMREKIVNRNGLINLSGE